MVTEQESVRGELPPFEELDAADFGVDFDWVADDLFTRDYQGLLRASDDSIVVYRNEELRELALSKNLTHQTLESMSVYWRENCPVHPQGLLHLLDEVTFSKRPPEHLPLKKLTGRRLTSQSVARFESVAIAAIEAQLSEVADGSEIDLVNDFAHPVIARFWSEVLGLPRAQSARLVALSADFQLSSLLTPSGTEIERACDSSGEYIATLTELLDRTTEAGDHEILIELAADFADIGEVGRPGNPNEALAATLLDGFQTFGLMVCNVLHPLLKAEKSLARVRTDPDLINSAFFEGIRLDPAVTLTSREAIDDFEYRGMKLAAGQKFRMLWLFGNRDPEVFAEPNVYKLERPDRVKQTMFGGGVYVCSGRNIVRMMCEAALRIFTRPTSEITPVGDVAWVPRSTIHKMSSMPVTIRQG